MAVDIKRALAIYERKLARYEAEGLEEQAAIQFRLMARLQKRSEPAGGDGE